MGSRRFCEDHCSDIRFAAVIITDLIGHDATDGFLDIPDLVKAFVPQLRKLVAVLGAETDGTFPAIVEAAARDAKDIRVLSTLYDYVGPVSDHAAFSQAGQPFLFLSCGQGKYYHHPQDDMHWINFEKLARITSFAADVIERIDRTPADANRRPHDPFETEIRMLRKAIGPALRVVMKYLKIKMPESRDDLTTVVGGLIDGKLPRPGR